MNCFCRGHGICAGCEGHICTGQCTCEIDGAPQTREETTAGWVNPSAAREQAWAEKIEANR